jgi:hypothetical protein
MNRSWNWCSVLLLTVRRDKAPCTETWMSGRAISRRIDDKLIRVLREKGSDFSVLLLPSANVEKKPATIYALHARFTRFNISGS